MNTPYGSDDALDDYARYRGKCKAMSEEVVANNPSLRLVRGQYICPVWGEQSHWWTQSPEGRVFDPTRDQFPSKGIGAYVEFSGVIECSNCGKEMKEEDAVIYGNYAFCGYRCNGEFVGVF